MACFTFDARRVYRVTSRVVWRQRFRTLSVILSVVHARWQVGRLWGPRHRLLILVDNMYYRINLFSVLVLQLMSSSRTFCILLLYSVRYNIIMLTHFPKQVLQLIIFVIFFCKTRFQSIVCHSVSWLYLAEIMEIDL